MSEVPGALSVTLKRVFDAPIHVVFEAWTDAKHVVHWMKCDGAASLEVENWVATPGTEFRTHMWLEGTFDAWGSGTFTEVDPPRLLAYTIHADPALATPAMDVRVEFAERGAQTELTLTHSGIPTDDLCGIIETGWTNSLAMLGERCGATVEGVAS